MNNIILLTDSYKTSHSVQYPPGTTNVYSYLESRGSDLSTQVQFFGLQYILMKYLVGQVVTQDKIDEAAELCELHGVPFNREGWEYILSAYNGRLPVRIKAVPEGTVVPTKNVLMTVENTDPKCFWLTNYLESLLVQVWYPCTVATLSRECKLQIKKHLRLSATDDNADFKLQDFGFRGVSSVESAAIGGAAHLINFKGTDTMVALTMLRKYYGEDCAGFSIPASEHSTITSWGRSQEAEAYRNMLQKYPTGLVACVSDSYNIYEACSDIWGNILKAEVLGRDGTLVVRPDSGNPANVVLECLERLGKAFGTTINTKGFKVLDPHVRVIQGDGVGLEDIDHILGVIHYAGWSAENVGFGMGGGLLQKLDRDTMKFAFKCSSVTVDGVDRDVFKSPIDAPFKQSKKGRVTLIKASGAHGVGYTSGLAPTSNREDEALQLVFENGELVFENTFSEIRRRAAYYS